MPEGALVVVGLLGLFIAWNLWRSVAGKVAPAQARALVESGARLVDVRSPGEFAGGHLPGAVNVPVRELARRLDELGARERAVVVYCQSGLRSANAARILRRAGFREVHDLGSLARWPER